jgi:hypothetical protein
MEAANTLAYYHMATITAVKSFIVQAPGEKLGLDFNSTCVFPHTFVTEKNTVSCN